MMMTGHIRNIAMNKKSNRRIRSKIEQQQDECSGLWVHVAVSDQRCTLFVFIASQNSPIIPLVDYGPSGGAACHSRTKLYLIISIM